AALRLFGADHASSEDQFLGGAERRRAREALRAAPAWDDPEVDLRLAEFGRAGGVAEVAGERELAAAAQGEAVDRRDRRLRHRLEQPPGLVPERAPLLRLADPFDPLVAFLEGAGLDGLLALGTTGEGILLAAAERRRAAELFVAARPEGFAVAVHCGAQTTRETVELSGHAADLGADGVAVIGPPYFALDERALLEHFGAAAQACEPLPFYVYEFAARSGYAVPLGVLHRLRDQASNFAGLKVSDRPWERFEPYLIEGLDVFVGPEGLRSEEHTSELQSLRHL